VTEEKKRDLNGWAVAAEKVESISGAATKRNSVAFATMAGKRGNE